MNANPEYAGIMRHGIACIGADQLPMHLFFIQEFGSIAGAFGSGKAENNGRLHVILHSEQEQVRVVGG